MLLVLEVWLTVRAWRAGWKGWALVPWAAGLVAAVVLAGVAGAPGAASDESIVMGLLADLALIAALAVMGRVRRAGAGGESRVMPETVSQRAAEAAEI